MASSKFVTEEIDVRLRSTIQTASARAMAGKINLLAESERIVFAFVPRRKLPSKNQISA